MLKDKNLWKCDAHDLCEVIIILKCNFCVGEIAQSVCTHTVYGEARAWYSAPHSASTGQRQEQSQSNVSPETSTGSHSSQAWPFVNPEPKQELSTSGVLDGFEHVRCIV